MATKAPPKKLSSLNSLFEQAADLRIKIAEAESQLRFHKETRDIIEQRILDAMIESGTEAHKVGGAGSFSIKRETVPQVIDWDKVWKFAIKNDAPQLFHRRLTTTAWREYGDSGILVSGTEAVTVTSLLWRSAK